MGPSGRQVVVALLVTVLVTGPASPAAAARLRFFQFNAAGHTRHNGTNPDLVPDVARSIKDFKPSAVSLNEICRSQFRAIRRRAARGDRGWRMYGAWRRTEGRKQTSCPGNLYGIGVLSRNRIEASNGWKLPGDDRRKLVCARTTLRSRPVRVCTTHIATASTPKRQRRQIRAVARRVNEWVTLNRPVVLMGDLNVTPGSSKLDPVYSARYRNGRGGFKEVDTPRDRRGGGATRGSRKIDYIFVSARHFDRLDGKATSTTTTSDHRPLRGWARLPPP